MARTYYVRPQPARRPRRRLVPSKATSAGGVQYRTSSATTSADHGGTGGTDTVTLPSGLTAGDLILITALCDAEPGGTISVPGAYTAVQATVAGNEGYPIMRSFWKIAGSSESDPSVTTTNTYICWFVSRRYDGTDQSAPIGNIGNADSGTGTGTTLDAPDITIQRDGSAADLVFVWEGDGLFGPTVTVPSGTTSMAEREGNGTFPSGGAAYELRATAGSYSPGNWTLTRGDTDIMDGIAQTIEIMPPSGVAPAVSEQAYGESMSRGSPARQACPMAV